MNKHIDGPWRVLSQPKRQDHFRRDHFIQAEIGRNVLPAWFTLAIVRNPDESEIGFTDGALNADSAAANARLMAAAPDLLKALRALLRDLDANTGDSGDDAIAEARAAVSKATGEPWIAP